MKVYRVEFIPAKQTVTGNLVAARSECCWLCDNPILTFDDGRYLICGECFKYYNKPRLEDQYGGKEETEKKEG